MMKGVLSTGKPLILLTVLYFLFCTYDTWALAPDAQRRRVFSLGSAAVLGASSWALKEHPALAVAPIAQTETDQGWARAVRFLRPSPPRILRPPLNRDFAVLLMRTSYAVVDQLDVIAMNQFQRDFFLIRSTEYEYYTKELGPGAVKQGDLTDPFYFDFISFAQYLTIQRALSDPASLFQEEQPIETNDDKSGSANINDPQRFQTVLVRRTTPNSELVRLFDDSVGTRILQYLDDTYGTTDLKFPTNSVYDALVQLVKLFLINGFAFDGSVQMLDDNKYSLVLVSPSNLWGHQCLEFQKTKVQNDYLRKTAQQLLLRMGYTIKHSVQFEGNKEVTSLIVRPFL